MVSLVKAPTLTAVCCATPATVIVITNGRRAAEHTIRPGQREAFVAVLADVTPTCHHRCRRGDPPRPPTGNHPDR